MRLGYPGLAGTDKMYFGSFNEAEAHAPRIHTSLQRTGLRRLYASMRPRRMRLGYLFAER